MLNEWVDLGRVKPPKTEFQVHVFIVPQIITMEIPNNVEWLFFF